MQGLFVRTPADALGPASSWRRPKSKKEVRELVKAGHLDCVKVEATSVFDNEYEGAITQDCLPLGEIIYFVGPDPYIKRAFYGTITRNTKGEVVVK